MSSQLKERPLPDRAGDEITPDPNRSPILDPHDRSPLLPPLRRPAGQPESAGRDQARSEAGDRYPDNQPETVYEPFLQAGLELGRINARLEVVEQGIAELEEFVDQHPEMVALEQKRDKLWDLAQSSREQAHRFSLEVAAAKNNRDQEGRRVRQYEGDVRAQCAEARATREAASGVWRQYCQAPAGSSEKAAFREEWSQLLDRARDELEAAIEADPNASGARRRYEQAEARYDKLLDESPGVEKYEQLWTDSLGFEKDREVKERIWADNPDQHQAYQALQEEESQLRSQRWEVRDRLEESTKKLKQPPQPAETEDRDADLVSHG